MRKIQVLVFCTALAPFVHCQAQEFPETGLPQEQVAKLFVDGKVISGSKYDVIRDITTNSSVQRLGSQAYVRVAFSSPKKSMVKPTAIDVSIGEVHSNFEWNYAQDVTVRCGDTTFTVPGSTSEEGDAAYKCELSANGGWVETYHVKISLAQLGEICRSESPYLRVGRNAKHTFDLSPLGKEAFLAVQQSISDLGGEEIEVQNEQPKLDTPQYSVTEFTTPAIALPSNYMGHDPFVVAENFAKLAQPKTEFETTTDFNKRKRAISKTPIVGSLTSIYDFALQLDNSDYSTAFDADKQILLVKLNFGFYLPASSPERTALKLGSRTIPLGSYVGTNSLGVQKEVLKYKQANIEFKFSDFKGFKIKPDSVIGIDSIGIQIPMTTEMAKKSKSNLRVLLVYTPQSPYISYYHNFVTPKVTSPLEKDLHWYYLHGQVKEFVFYDFESGQILLRLQSKN